VSLYVLDTDILSLFRKGHRTVHGRLVSHSANELAISVISVEEGMSGWYKSVRKAKEPASLERAYQGLADMAQFLGKWQVLPYPETAIARYQQLAKMKLKVRKMDLRIAAIVLENNAILVTRNLRDFRRVPNLIVEDWSV
jgi:tRNA(fMet)-specific endonuclease VapC